MTEIRITTRPDTTDMVAVHAVLRQAVSEIPMLLGPAGEDASVASYYDNVLRFLQVHHEAEDVLVWPKLLERCPVHAGLIAEMRSEHQAIHAALDEAEKAVSDWLAAPEAPAARRAADALAELGHRLLPHLDREEEAVLPLCSEYLTPEEWGEMPGHALAHFDGDKVWLILGLIRQNMSRAQRDAMLENMPPPARDMWINLGQAAFDDFMPRLPIPSV